MIATGLGSFLSMVSEATVGTDPGSGYKYLRLVSHSLLPEATPTQGNRGLGRLGVSGIRNRLKRNEGDVELDLQYEGYELPILHFAGGTDSFSADTPSAGANTHIFAPSTTRQIGLTVHLNEVVTRTDVTGLKVNRMRVNISNENLGVTFGMIGNVHSAGSVDTPSYPTSPDVVAIDGTPGTEGLVASLDSSPFNVRGVTLDFNLPHTTDREYLGNGVMQESVPQDRMAVSGQITREFEDTTWSAKWLADTAARLDFAYTSTQTIGASAVPYSTTLTLYAVLLQKAKGPVDSGGVLIERIPFTAYVDGSGNYWQWKFINGLASAVA